MQKKGKEQDKSWSRLLKGVLWGCLWAFLICVVLIFVCSIGISCGFLNEKYMQGYVFAACALGCLIGGLFAASRCGSRILLIALAVSAAMFFVQLAAGIVFCSETHLLGKWAYVLGANLVGGVTAGLVYGKKDTRRKVSTRR